MYVRQPTTIDLNESLRNAPMRPVIRMNYEGSAESRRSALEKLQESLSLWEIVSDPLWEATTLFYLGVIHSDFGEAQEAMAY